MSALRYLLSIVRQACDIAAEVHARAVYDAIDRPAIRREVERGHAEAIAELEAEDDRRHSWAARHGGPS